MIDGLTERPSWDEYFIGVTVAVSARGDCIRSKVGAVLVEDSTHRIISAGYNGSLPGGPSCLAGECPRCLSDVPSGSNYEGCIEVHAERNCMDYANRYGCCHNTEYRNGYTIHWWYGHTLYLTREPCSSCWPFLLDQHVPRVVWIETATWDYPIGGVTYQLKERLTWLRQI